MKRLLHPFLLFTVLLAAMAGLVACGGDDNKGSNGKAAVTDEMSADDIVKKAFTANPDIKSGVMAVTIDGIAEGDKGKLTVKGPFESQGEKALPKLDLDISADGSGQNLKAGIMLTGDKAYINFNNSDYELDDQYYQQFKRSFEQSASQQSKDQTTFAQLGIDPKKWMKNPENAGDSSVDGTPTVKATGDVEVGPMLRDLNVVVEKAGSLGATGSANVPKKLTDEQIKQVEESVKSLKFEVEGAKSDGSLRRLKLDLDAVNSEDPSETAKGFMEITLSQVNEPQQFNAPSGAKPFSELLGAFGGLGGLGGGMGSGSGSDSGGSSGAGGSTSDQQKKLEEYSECIQSAGSDATKAQACAEKLG